MPTLVDSNVILDVINSDPVWLDWSVQQLNQASSAGPLLINSVIYAEVSIGFLQLEEMMRCVQAMRLEKMPLSEAALFRAGKAFLQYRRSGGARTSPLPDFLIGAQAEVEGWTLISRDRGRFSSYFPDVNLITPGNH